MGSNILPHPISVVPYRNPPLTPPLTPPPPISAFLVMDPSRGPNSWQAAGRLGATEEATGAALTLLTEVAAIVAAASTSSTSSSSSSATAAAASRRSTPGGSPKGHQRSPTIGVVSDGGRKNGVVATGTGAGRDSVAAEALPSASRDLSGTGEVVSAALRCAEAFLACTLGAANGLAALEARPCRDAAPEPALASLASQGCHGRTSAQHSINLREICTFVSR